MCFVAALPAFATGSTARSAIITFVIAVLLALYMLRLVFNPARTKAMGRLGIGARAAILSPAIGR
jgi:hypothetical protein